MILQVEDGGGLTDLVNLHVFVEKNEFPPVFENNNANIERVIEESTPEGKTIVVLTASDDDIYVSRQKKTNQTLPYC